MLTFFFYCSNMITGGEGMKKLIARMKTVPDKLTPKRIVIMYTVFAVLFNIVLFMPQPLTIEQLITMERHNGTM